jgi:hypothetical protein
MTAIPTGLDVDTDIDGNDINPPPATTDVGQLIYLLEWARKRGFRVGPTVRCGSLVLQVQDLRQTEGRDTPAADDPGPWAAAGHDLGDA